MVRGNGGMVVLYIYIERDKDELHNWWKQDTGRI